MPDTEAILPATHAPSGIRFAPGVRAGRWVFATGQKGTASFAAGISPEVLRRDLPEWDGPKLRREADQIFRNVSAVLEAGGSSLQNVVRVDQYYLGPRAVECYHDARREYLKDHIPPSTSTLTRGFLLADQEIEAHMIGIIPGHEFSATHIRPPSQQVHPSSGYSIAVAAGDYVFVAGRIADSWTFGEGVAKEARQPPGYLWKGTPVKRETEFIVRKKLVPALEAAASSLRDLVKCQVYLRDPADFAPFNEVWQSFFGPEGPPATSLIAASDPAFTVAELRVEINAIAVRSGGKVKREPVNTGGMPTYRGYPQAVRAGDLLFLSGLLAIDENGLVGGARRDPAMPYFNAGIQAQMEAILGNADRICRAAGTSLANVVRIQQFQTDLNEFYQAYQVWDRFLPGQHYPLSAIEVPFLPVGGCTVQLDLWVYVPGGAQE